MSGIRSRLGPSIDDQARELTEAFFRPALRNLRLGPDQIAAQDLEELQASLNRVNEAIAHATEFGTYSLEMTASGGKLAVVATTAGQGHVTVSILPLLLNAKTEILDRIGELSPQEPPSTAPDQVIQDLADPDERERVSQLFERQQQANAEKELRHAQETVQNTAIQARQAQELREKDARLNMELKARHAEIRKSYLSRDTVAGAVGPILLLVLASALIVAMFSHTTVSAPVSDSFLLVLGYFFGNATTQKAIKAKKKAAPKGIPAESSDAEAAMADSVV